MKFCFLFLPISLFSQTGVLKFQDFETGMPLSEVNIIFSNINSTNNQYAISSTNGTTPNIIISKSKLSLILTGYISTIDTISPNTSKTYFLKPDVFQINQVVVTATRTPKNLKNTPIITQVITAKQIEARGFQNVMDVLQVDIPNIEIQQHGYGANLNVQGLKPVNILILIDGERLAGESRGNIDYSRLNTQEIERIEVVKGASSSLFGSQAMGAVINIITKKSNKKFYASVSSQFTSFYEKNFKSIKKEDEYYTAKKNLDRFNLTQNYTVGFNLDKWSSKTNFAHKTKDAYQLFGKDSISGYYSDLDTLVNKPIEFYPTNVNGIKDYTIFQSIGYKVNNKININTKASYYQHDEFDFVYFDNKRDFFNDFTYSIKASYKQNEKYNYVLSWNSDIYNKYDYFEKSNNSSKNYRHRTTNPKLTGSFQLNEKHLLISGIEYLDESLLSNQFNYDRELITKSISNTVFYIQDDYQLTKKWNAVIGLRSEFHNTFGLNFSPKLSVMYKKYPFTIRTSIASGYRSPSIKELYSNWDLLGLFLIKGNEQLKPETNKYISTSLEYSKSKINTSLSLYRNAFKDKIEGVFNYNQTIYQYQNTENSTLIGIDYNLHYRPLKAWFLKLAYSYVHENKNEGFRLSTLSPHAGSLQVGYNYKKKNYDLNVSINGKYTGAKDAYATDIILYRGNNIEATYKTHYSDYSIWRFSIYQKYKNTSFTIGVNNLFNYTPEVYTFNTTTSNGRSYFIGLKININ